MNDAVVESGATRVLSEDTVTALGRMRRAVDPVPLLLVEPPAVDDDQQNLRIARIDAALQEEAARLDIPHLSCFTSTRNSSVWRREVRNGDRYHPGAAGYELLASICSDQIIDWLDRP